MRYFRWEIPEVPTRVVKITLTESSTFGRDGSFGRKGLFASPLHPPSPQEDEDLLSPVSGIPEPDPQDFVRNT